MICAGVVALGVFLEEAGVWFPSLSPQLDKAKGTFNPNPLLRWRKRIEHLGWALIVLFIVAEAGFEGATFIEEGLLQDFGTTRLTAAENKEARMSKDFNDLKTEDAEKNNQLNMAYLELAKRYSELGNSGAELGSRPQLLEDNKDEFIKALRPFSPQRIILVSCGLKGDAELEANALERALFAYFGREAGWAVEEYQGRPATEWDCEAATRGDPVTIPGGIMLVLSNNWTERHSAVVAAQKLEQTLNKLNITTRIAADTKLDNAAVLADGGTFWKYADATLSDDPKAIFLLVGPNPLVSFTDQKKKPK